MFQTEKGVHQAMEQAMVRTLYREWDQVVWGLGKKDPALASGMKRPGIIISDMERLLGKWDPSRHEISLSRELVVTGRWDSIVEVFRHEIAHQAASTLPAASGQSPHGPLFRGCCELVGANPRASGTYQTLEERVWGNADDGPDRLMLKVKKLMSLASSDNRNEAENAAAKAGELIAKYNMDIIDGDRDRQFESIIITPPALKRSQAESLMVSLLSSFYFVRPVWIPVYIPASDKMGKALEISGTPENLKIADYVFHYVLGHAARRWERYRKQHPSCRSRSGYMTGVVSGFRQKLEEGRRASEAVSGSGVGASSQVMVREDHRLVRYFHRRYPALQTTRVHAVSSSRAAFQSGLSEGRHLIVAKGISDTGAGAERFLLPDDRA